MSSEGITQDALRSPKLTQLLSALGVLLFSTLISVPCFAHPKTDTLLLENGDTLTGEIKGMSEGQMRLSTDYLDTVQVEWEHVLSVISEYQYEVRTRDGTRHYGSLEAAEDKGTLRINSIYGPVDLPVLDVIEIRVIGGTFKDKLDLKISAGLSLTQASDSFQFNTQTTINYENISGVTGFNGRTTVSIVDDDEQVSNRYALSRQAWTKKTNVIRWISGTYEDNDSLGLDYRFSLAVGLGRAFIDHPGFTLQGAVGVQTNNELTEIDGEQESIEGVFGVRVAAWRFNTPKLSLEFDYSLYPSITESNRVRTSSDFSFNWELVKDFYWNLSAWRTFDNSNPEENDSDYGLTTGLAWKY